MLTQTAFQPLYGRVSDLMGRKVSRFYFYIGNNHKFVLYVTECSLLQHGHFRLGLCFMRSRSG